MNIKDRYHRAEGLSLDTQRKLTMLNTFINDGETPIEPMEPEHWLDSSWVACGLFAVVVVAFLVALATGMIAV